MNFSSSINLASLDGDNGFRIDGIDEGDGSGISVSFAGDVNGDGIDDLIIGAWGGDPAGQGNAGESYVVFGSATGFGASLDLDSLNGSNGFRIAGIDSLDDSGYSVSGAGDVNGDGIDDLIIGAYRAEPPLGPPDCGESYIVFGSSSGFFGNLDLRSLNGSNGFRIEGVDQADFSGRSVSGAGDVNGDGVDDIIIGADYADPNGRLGAGESYIVFGSTSGFASIFDLSGLDGSNGFRIDGAVAGEESGTSVSNAGDVNGDGIDDIVIGADRADPNGRVDAGSSYVVFGSASGFAPSLGLGSLDGMNGFRIDGIAGDFSGVAVSSAGDVNGDGVDDLLIGGALADADGNLDTGKSYVIFGSGSGFASSLDLSTLNGSNGFRIDGVDQEDLLGASLSGVGDINGDGIDDFIIGATGADPDGQERAGESYVVFGTATGFASILDLGSLDGSNGFRIDGVDEWDLSGSSVSGGGDVNGDGIDDIIIGAPLADPDGDGLPVGSSYVIFGKNTTELSLFAANDFYSTEEDTPLLAGVADGVLANDVVLDGVNQQAVLISNTSNGSLSLNDDGSFTYIPNADFNGTDSFSYVVSVDTGIDNPSLDLATLDGNNGFRIEGIDSSGRAGSSVSSVGDINNDGIDDLIIGAPFANSGTGEAYVVFGSASPFASSIELTSLDGSNGFQITGVGSGLQALDRLGWSVSGAGDVNNDGIDDLIIGAPFGDYSGEDSGGCYVIFGSSIAFSSSFNLATLNGSNGFRINGFDVDDQAGISVSGAGDVNGDGIDDFIVGADLGGAGPFVAGESYVIFGSGGGFSSSLSLRSLNGSNGFRIVGIDPGDSVGYSVAGAGDVNGDGVNDLVIGARTADPNMTDNAGETYVVFGSTSSFPSILNLASLNGSNGFTINGIDQGDFSGYSVSGAGDVNGDGIDDLIIGAPMAGGPSECYVVFGSSSGFSPSLNLANLDGRNGFLIIPPESGGALGWSVSAAGDLNGDGLSDVIIGAPYADADAMLDAGESYVIYGSSAGFPSTFDLTGLDGRNGFSIRGVDLGDWSGYSVSEAGDINADGIVDVIIGARNAGDPIDSQFAGESYVVFGKASETQVSNVATVNITVNAVNDAPVLVNEIPDQIATENQLFEYTIPENTFTDVDEDDVLSFSATLENGQPLPEWLTFDADTATFNGTPASGSLGVLTILVKATDLQGQVATETFQLTTKSITYFEPFLVADIWPGSPSSRETLESLPTMRENSHVIAGVDRLYGHQAVRFW